MIILEEKSRLVQDSGGGPDGLKGVQTSRARSMPRLKNEPVMFMTSRSLNLGPEFENIKTTAVKLLDVVPEKGL